MYAERLTELAVALGFDGWLVEKSFRLHNFQFSIIDHF